MADTSIPAFPNAPNPDVSIGGEGMSLLDYFAAHAMASLTDRWSRNAHPEASTIAKYAYAMAEAMIAERNRRNG